MMIFIVGTRREWSLKAKNWRFTYSEIVNITNNFKSVIGEGGFGRVYHGSLTHGIEVAIKVLSSSSRQGSNEFQNEVDTNWPNCCMLENLQI